MTSYQKLKHKNKRLDAIIVALLRSKYSTTNFNLGSKHTTFPIMTDIGLIHFETETINLI